ncbi:hypothetical protein FIV06_09130 [Labrenzia sp. THAF191b]|uniref:hypothetical protein n=1 Tax=unclassified Labrenzia TaxID=2648686 RepID=UPI001268B6EB|nr:MULTISPECIES: hypothetical protein [unclassified Labrenzia]QFS97583.1 hypothetical protein FIV06_09130 [Labrenzia sp. THAF191b]QFT03898.1 hypothetical protein FIV05_09130 [Labrenzia sp. THAF191a]QFT15440.1 hypothetical protein FIV03_09135 [Labrenzia sp. THAF187b]
MNSEDLRIQYDQARLARAKAEQKMLETRLAADKAESAFYDADKKSGVAFERWSEAVRGSGDGS